MAGNEGEKMKILCSPLYEKQLKEILNEIAEYDFNSAKSFKLYLDTIAINIPTKASKYKQSQYSTNEKVKDIIYENYIIPSIIDLENHEYILLSIIKKN